MDKSTAIKKRPTKVPSKTTLVSKEAILSGHVSTQPSTSMLIDELYKQRQSSRSIIDSKNKLISEMAKKLTDRTRADPVEQPVVKKVVKQPLPRPIKQQFKRKASISPIDSTPDTAVMSPMFRVEQISRSEADQFL